MAWTDYLVTDAPARGTPPPPPTAAPTPNISVQMAPTSVAPAGTGAPTPLVPPTMDLSGIAPDIPVQRESGGRSWVGYTSPETLKKQGHYTDLYNAPVDDSGAPIWAGDMGPAGKSTAFGPAQITTSTWRPIAKRLGITDWRAPGAYVAVANELRRERGLDPWKASEPGSWSNALVTTSTPEWKPSENGIRMEMEKPDTTVYGGSLQDYMLLNDLDASALDPKKRARLDKSLSKGDEVETPPEIEVKVKDGKAYVIDQDGLHRMMAAADAGVNFAPIAFKGIKAGQKVDTIVTPSGKEIPFNLTAYPRPHEAPKAPTTAQSFGMGVGDVAVGGAQLASHLVGGAPTFGSSEFGGAPAPDMPAMASPAGIDYTVAQREAAYERGREAGGQTGTDWARLAGNVVGTAPLAAIMPGGVPANMLARVGQAAAMGGVGGALAPVTSGDYGSGLARNVGLGALTGGAFGAGGEAVSRVAAPYVQPAAQRLMDAGVNMLTPGMMRGGLVKGAENRLSSMIPTIAGATRRAVESFNKAAYNKILGRIGEKYEGTEVGYKGIEQVEKQLGREYDKVLKDVEFARTPKFNADLQNLRDLAQELPESDANRFEAILNNRVLKRMGPQGTMDGQTFKQVESELSGVSRELHRSQGPYAMGEHQLGDAVDTLNGMLRENIEDQNPAVAASLRRVNGAWAAFVAMRKAAANRGTSLGVFTPSDLLTGAKRAAGERVFARGRALMQDLASDAQEVIPNTYPDSGTAGRLLTAAMIGEAGRMLHPGALAVMAGGSAAYTQPGNALMQAIAGRGYPAVRNALANITRQATQRLAPPAALSYTLANPPAQSNQP